MTSRASYTNAVVAIILSAGMACTGGARDAEVTPEPLPVEQALEVKTVTASDVAALGDGLRLTVDLRRGDRAYLFDQSRATIDLSRIDLVCPNGVAMPMDRWSAQRARELGVDITSSDDGRFLVAPAAPGRPVFSPAPPVPGNGVDPTCECHAQCFTCRDGAYVCRTLCNRHDCKGDPGRWPEWVGFGRPSERPRGAGPDPSPYKGGATDPSPEQSGAGRDSASPSSGGRGGAGPNPSSRW